MKQWHGRDDAWLTVEKEVHDTTVTRDVELCDLLDYDDELTREDMALLALIVAASRESVESVG